MPLDFSNNEYLIKELKKGHESAYAFLVEIWHHRLCVYAYGLSRDHDKAEDIVQNVFVRLWQQRDKLKTNFSLKGFLYRSVYNEFIDQYRKQQSVRILEQKYIDALDTLVEQEDEASLEKLIILIQQEIENLPPKCKETFLLSKQDGLSNKQIAEQMGVSVKAVEAHMTRAFYVLRKKLGGKMGSVLFLLFGKMNAEKMGI